MFDEDFVFEVDPQEISKHTLEVTLCDFVAYSRHRNIGTIRLQLSTIDLHQVTDVWKELKACTEREVKADLGDLMVAFSYLPSAERLTVTIIKARNLKIVDETRTSSGKKPIQLSGHVRFASKILIARLRYQKNSLGTVQGMNFVRGYVVKG